MKRGSTTIGLKVLLAGLLIGIGGFLLFQAGRGNQAAHAAGGGGSDYTGDWVASKLYQLMYTDNADNQSSANAIGVAEWKVTYNDSTGAELARETWDGPVGNTIKLDYSNIVNNVGCRATFDKTKWLGGCYSNIDDGSAYHYTLNTVDTGTLNVFSKNSSAGDKVSAQGTGVFCVSGNCFNTSGAYGFIRNTTGGTTTQTGVMMPLEWKVTGHLD